MKTKAIFGEFMVHFNLSGSGTQIEFEVYPIINWTHLPTGNTGFSYMDKGDYSTQMDEFEEGKCLMKFQGSYCWRGVWEGRIYFTDDEYWGEELMEMASLFEKDIEPLCKQAIKLARPEYLYDE